MNGNEIESHLFRAMALTVQAQQKLATHGDFCIAGMKSASETREFLLGIESARLQLENAGFELLSIEQLYARAKGI